MNIFKLLSLTALVTFSCLTQASKSEIDHRNAADLSLYGGWSKAEKNRGFGGNSAHTGLDFSFYFSQNWFLNLNFHGDALGKSTNTTLSQQSFSFAAGYRYSHLRVWFGLGSTTQSKYIDSPNFYYEDPAPSVASKTIVEDYFLSWATAVAYDFIVTEPTDNFPWHFAIGPNLRLSDTFQSNGFAPIFSAGLALSLL